MGENKAALDNDSDSDTSINIDAVERMRTIGTGSFGRVYLARDTINQKNYYALKKMSISKVILTRQINHVFSEKKILASLKHPFIVKMYNSKCDGQNLYILFEYIPGGELFSYLRNVQRFSALTARFYTCEVILALEYLHSKNIAYRDLKPENLMLTKIGHLKLTDFGFAKIITDQTNTLCGTPEYLAPEVIIGNGYNKSVDWWSLGILIYEMVVGLPPFQGDTITDIYAEMLTGRIRLPKNMDFFIKDFIKMLLQLDPAKRLGNLKGGVADIKIHKWFSDIIWDDVINMKITSPIIPRLQSTGDTSNFDDYDEESDEDQTKLSQEEIDLFHDW
uniref:Protein kinase domain-containing protein n=1 Tax=Onchocerca volvulus TaxID=6282 RepID=A0A8R1TR80_ONCVO